MFEVRDRRTFMPVMAIKPEGTSDGENFLLSHAGYGNGPTTQKTYVLLVDMSEPPGTLNYDPYAWGDRTLTHAHMYIADHFDELESGQVVDVQFVLGETAQPKPSERLSARSKR